MVKEITAIILFTFNANMRQVMYAKSDTNVLCGHGIAAAIGKVKKGDKVIVSRIDKDMYIGCSEDGIYGYFLGDSLTHIEPEPEVETIVTEIQTWNGARLTPSAGVVYGPSGKETYYNLNMSGVVSIMRGIGNTDAYWVRSDGCKMLGNYIMVAANLNVHPRGSLVQTSLGMGIVCDTGGFAYINPNQIDIATTW